MKFYKKFEAIVHKSNAKIYIQTNKIKNKIKINKKVHFKTQILLPKASC